VIVTNDDSTRGRLFRPRDHEEALRGLEAIGPALGDAGVPALIVLLTGGDDAMKIRAADLLGAMGPAAKLAVTDLRSLAGANAPASRAAKDALRRIEGVPYSRARTAHRSFAAEARRFARVSSIVD
jgi:hypothetical protein